MKLDRVAIWTRQLEKLKMFYIRYFKASANLKYIYEYEVKANNKIRFESYSLTFESGARLELIKKASIVIGNDGDHFNAGITQITFCVNSPDELEWLFADLKVGGIPIVRTPHVTGDGYYEACVLDPDGNRIEIAVKL